MLVLSSHPYRLGGGYSRIYGSLTGTNLVPELFPASPSSSPSPSSSTASFLRSEGVWGRLCVSACVWPTVWLHYSSLLERFHRDLELFFPFRANRLTFRCEAGASVKTIRNSASVLRTQRRKGHVVFVSSQLLASSCLLLLTSYGWRCLFRLIFTVCWPPRERKRGSWTMYPHHCRCTPTALRPALFSMSHCRPEAWQGCVSHAFLF